MDTHFSYDTGPRSDDGRTVRFDSRFLKPACVSDAGLSRISPLIKLMMQHNVEAYSNMRQCHRYLKSDCLPSRAAESLRQERRMYGLPHLPSSLRLDRSP